MLPFSSPMCMSLIVNQWWPAFLLHMEAASENIASGQTSYAIRMGLNLFLAFALDHVPFKNSIGELRFKPYVQK